jgi:hypothetical protein
MPKAPQQQQQQQKGPSLLGAGRHRPEASWRALAGSLVARGLLEFRVTAGERPVSAPVLTPLGRARLSST